jgi:hypothetical protein
MAFLISALRAIVEMLACSLLGQGALALLAGRRAEHNAVYAALALITRQPRHWVAAALRLPSESRRAAIACFIVLFALWIGLAILRKFL